MVPKIYQNKTTKVRYIKYKNKKYYIKSTATNKYLIKNFFNIIKQLIAQTKAKKRTAKKRTADKSDQKNAHNQPVATGSSFGSDNSKILSYQQSNKASEEIQKLKAETQKMLEDIYLSQMI